MQQNIEPIVPFGQELIVSTTTKTMEPMVTKRKNQIYRQFAERLHLACDNHGITRGRGRATEVGRLVGVGYKGASKWLSGDGMPDMGHAADLATELDVNFEWLMTGRGIMTVNAVLFAAEETEKYKGQGTGALSQEAIAVAKKFDCIKSPDDRTSVQKVVNAIASAGHVKKKASNQGKN